MPGCISGSPEPHVGPCPSSCAPGTSPGAAVIGHPAPRQDKNHFPRSMLRDIVSSVVYYKHLTDFLKVNRLWFPPSMSMFIILTVSCFQLVCFPMRQVQKKVRVCSPGWKRQALFRLHREGLRDPAVDPRRIGARREDGPDSHRKGERMDMSLGLFYCT